jgi:hypothetical protein
LHTRITRENTGPPFALLVMLRSIAGEDLQSAEAFSKVRCLKPEIEFANQLVVVELIGRAAFEGDLAVDDDVSAVGDADRLVEVTAAA